MDNQVNLSRFSQYVFIFKMLYNGKCTTEGAFRMKLKVLFLLFFINYQSEDRYDVVGFMELILQLCVFDIAVAFGYSFM